MRFSFRLSVLSVAVVLAAQLATAAAAQGVNPLRTHTVHGYVGGVQAGNGAGMLYVMRSNRNQMAGGMNLGGANFAGGNFAGANLAGGNLVGGAALGGGQMFQLGPQTQIVAVRGSMRMPFNIAALRPGMRVSVRAIGQQAAVVQVYPRQGYAGTTGRSRSGRPRRTASVAPLSNGTGTVAPATSNAASTAAAMQRAAAWQAAKALRAQQVSANKWTRRK
jgi:uncharacterized protein YjbI with pentapeptide repeats